VENALLSCNQPEELSLLRGVTGQACSIKYRLFVSNDTLCSSMMVFGMVSYCYVYSM
jgi:hypothetical protein